MNSRQRWKKHRARNFNLAGNKLKMLRFQRQLAKATQIPLKLLYSDETANKIHGLEKLNAK
jgi:hypothetical protein